MKPPPEGFVLDDPQDRAAQNLPPGFRMDPLPQQESLYDEIIRDREKVKGLKVIEDVAGQVVSDIVRPLYRTRKQYRKEYTEASRTVREAVENPGWLKTPLGIAFGTMQYIFSPVTAVAKGIVGEPIEEGLESVGTPEGVAKFAGKLGEEAVYFVPIGGTIKTAMMRSNPALRSYVQGQEAVELARGAKRYAEKRAKEQGTKIFPDISGPSKLKTGEILSEGVKSVIVDDITKAAESALSGKFDESKRIFKQIAEYIAIGEIDPGVLPEVLQRHNLSPVEFAKMYAETVSTAGRLLGYHSRAAKKLRAVFKDNPEVLDIMVSAQKGKTGTAVDKFMDFYANVENTRRAMLVTQMSTAMRNVWSQAGRVTIGAFDDAMQGAISALFGGEGMAEAGKRSLEGLQPALAALNRMRPKQRKRLAQILDETEDVVNSMRLMSQPVQEVHLGGKITRFLTAMNRAQEGVFRKLAFEAKLRQQLSRAGLDYNTIDPKKIPNGFVEEAVNYALEMSFAQSPKSKKLGQFIRAWSQTPLTLIQPFPRFNFASAIPFVFEHSPLGYLSAVKPSTIKALASGDTREFARAASRATLGTMMFDIARGVRNSPYAGEKWYELKVGEYIDTDGTKKDKVMDTRAYAPFSTYLFLAEVMDNPKNLKPFDYAQAAVGLNRIAGTGLVALDWIRAKSGESFEKQAKNFAGAYISSFFTPSRSVSDFYQAIDKEEGYMRDTRQSPLIGPTMSAIPELSQMLPESRSPLRKGAIKKTLDLGKIPASALRQVTGFSVQEKNEIEKEVDKIQLPSSSFLARTGDPEADRWIHRHMYSSVKTLFPYVVNNETYKHADPALKRIMLGAMFQKAKANAKIQLSLTHPRLAAKIRIEGMSKDMQTLIEKRIDVKKLLENLETLSQ